MADNSEWGVGQCVTLKSGSPKMVITEGPATKGMLNQSPGDTVSTIWFDGGECREGKFLIACLDHAA